MLWNVAVFENTGVDIGVTMPHPHGQNLAFPFVPPLVEKELGSPLSTTARRATAYTARFWPEHADGRRVVAENDGFVAFLPFDGRFPTELHIFSRRHVGKLRELSGSELQALASMVSMVRRKYDSLYGFQCL